MPSARCSSTPTLLVLSVATVALIGSTHCGGESKTDLGSTAGSKSGGDAGSAGSATNGGSAGAVAAGASGSGGSSGSASAGASNSCGGSHSMPVGRPTAPACAPTPAGTTTVARTCSADGDCADAGLSHCLAGKCGLDQCLIDSDCASGQACRCSNQVRGDALLGNSCVPTGCRVDADCGPSGSCSPDSSGYCGSVDGYQCHSAADTCNSDTDCCGSTPRCGYQPALGHWACAAIVVCSG